MIRLLPARGVARSLVLQSAIYSTGSGTFIAGSAVFFVKVVGMNAQQAGAGLSIAGFVSFALAVPLGVLTDRVGALRVWQLSAFAEATIFALYPVVRGLAAFICVIVAITIILGTGNGGRGAYTIAILPKEIRIETMAYARSAFNVGFTAGAAIAGAVIAIDRPWAYYAMPLFNAVLLLASGVLILRLPHLAERPGDERANPLRVLRDVPFMAVSLLTGLLQLHVTLLMVVVPLWLIIRTDAPPVTAAILIGLNTITAVLFQVHASRGSQTVPGAAKALLRAGFLIAGGCAVTAVSDWTSGTLTIVALAVGYLMMTGGELYHSAGQWGLSAELPPAARRAEYLGAMRLGAEAQRMVGPAALTGVVMAPGGYGWLAIGAFALTLGILAGPATRWASRDLTGRLAFSDALAVPVVGQAAGPP
jgi:hypothetical protein